MKKWMAIFLMSIWLLTLAGCADGGTEPDGPQQAEPSAVEQLRRQMEAQGETFAVAYLGYMPSDCANVWDYINTLGEDILEELSFLLQIPEKNVIGSASFGEVYCLIPADPRAFVEVYAGSEDTAFDAEVFLGSREEPYLLICNADVSPDTQVIITDFEDRDLVTVWNPQLDEYLYVKRFPYGENSFRDISPYRALLQNYYENMIDEQTWSVPDKESLVNTAWYWDGYTLDGNYYEYSVSFHENTLDAHWNLGDGEEHDYRGAQWKWQEGDIPVLTIDFDQFAGVRRYNLLVDWDDGFMYIAADAAGEELTWDSEPQYRFLLEKKAESVDPMMLTGAWERTQTEVDGYVEQMPAGQVTLQITGNSQDDLRIAYTDREFPDNNYSDKAVFIIPDGDIWWYGDVAWVAQVNHTGTLGQSYLLALVDDALVIRNDFTVDGAPAVSYEIFRRVN